MNWLEKTAQVMTLQDVQDYLEQNDRLGYFRYVRSNGEYRFADAATMYASSHEQLVGDDTPESAGFIKIYPKGFYIEGFSTTLQLGPDASDESYLSRLLSMPAIERY